MSHARIVIPYVTFALAPETRVLGEQLGAEFVLTDGPTDYWDLLERLWAEGESLILMEQDVVPSVELLEEMWACDREWCHAPVQDLGWPTLAFHKFHSDLLRRLPDAVERAGRMYPSRRWTQLDFGLMAVLGWSGLKDHGGPHMHHERGGGRAVHLHNEMDRRRGGVAIMDLERQRQAARGAGFP